MRCKYGTGSEATWLTGTPWQEDVAPITWQGQQLVSTKPLIGRATPSIRSLGNAADQLPLTIVRQFPTELDAIRFCAEILWELPASGELTLIDQTATDQITITYSAAAFQSVTRQRQGLAVLITYTFLVGGPPTITAISDAPLRINTESGTYITTET